MGIVPSSEDKLVADVCYLIFFIAYLQSKLSVDISVLFGNAAKSCKDMQVSAQVKRAHKHNGTSTPSK